MLTQSSLPFFTAKLSSNTKLRNLPEPKRKSCINLYSAETPTGNDPVKNKI